jgi:hypothetical protein
VGLALAGPAAGWLGTGTVLAVGAGSQLLGSAVALSVRSVRAH